MADKKEPKVDLKLLDGVIKKVLAYQPAKISAAAEKLAVYPRELSRLLHGVVKIPLPV